MKKDKDLSNLMIFILLFLIVCPAAGSKKMTDPNWPSIKSF